MKKIQFLISLLVLSISASLSLAAWNPPTMSPPNANTDPPINQSSSSQVKAGGLGLGSLLVSGTSVFDGILSMFEQSSSPSGEAGYGKIYWKTDHKLYKMDSSGVETEIGAGGGKIDDLDDGINASGDTTLALGTNAGISDDATDNRNTFVGIGAGKDTSTGISNSAFGYQALWENTTGQDNTAIGREALSSSTTASSNTAVGAHALSADTTGVDNVAVGTYALLSNHGGSHNTALGMNALRMNDSGSYNTAIGKQAMESNTTGGANTATGFTAMFHNTTGQDNAAYGYAALHFSNGWSNAAFGTYSLHENTSGDNNAAVGRGALYENKDGNRNIAIGYQSGSKIADGTTANTTGDNNIFIGADTKANADGDQNEIVIGDNATGHGSNTVTIGNNSVTATYLRGNIYKNGVLFGGGKFVDGTDSNDAVYTTGNVGIGTTDPTEKLDIVGNLQLKKYSGKEWRFVQWGSGDHFNITGPHGSALELQRDVNNAVVTVGAAGNGAASFTVYGNTQINGAITAPEGTLRDDGGGWVRTYGNTGWYSQTHGGGWYMTDSTWLRTYGNKSIYTGGGQINLGNGWLTHAYLNNQDCYTAHWSDDDGKCNNGYYLAGMDEHGDDIDSFECCRPG